MIQTIEDNDNVIKDGQTYILFEDRKPKSMITIQDGQTFQNKYGAFHHQQMIGQKLGTKIWSKSRQGSIHLVKPNPFLITETVPHKTQILFQMDISMILMMLDIRPGKSVVESGTGSGSLSCSLTQALTPGGKLYTYEFNEDRAINGQQLIKKLGFHETTTVFWRDVYGNGFQKVNEDNKFNNDKEFPENNTVDAIFLDLPQPWLALNHASNIIKVGGRICTFSPCIEQVQKSCQKLKEDGWKGLKTIECLKRHFERRVKTEISLFSKRKAIQEVEEGESSKKLIKTEKGETQQLEHQQQNNLEQTKSQIEKKKIFYSAGISKAYGHTGYLTFAFKQ